MLRRSPRSSSHARRRHAAEGHRDLFFRIPSLSSVGSSGLRTHMGLLSLPCSSATLWSPAAHATSARSPPPVPLCGLSTSAAPPSSAVALARPNGVALSTSFQDSRPRGSFGGASQSIDSAKRPLQPQSRATPSTERRPRHDTAAPLARFGVDPRSPCRHASLRGVGVGVGLGLGLGVGLRDDAAGVEPGDDPRFARLREPSNRGRAWPQSNTRVGAESPGPGSISLQTLGRGP